MIRAASSGCRSALAGQLVSLLTRHRRHVERVGGRLLVGRPLQLAPVNEAIQSPAAFAAAFRSASRIPSFRAWTSASWSVSSACASPQIDATYGHLVSDSEEYLRGLLDRYDVKAASSG
jgi:hypothetical protein